MYWIDPLSDPRWADLIARHPQASLFHTPSWLQALHRTYGYRPLALTTTPPGADLVDGIPFCEVKSWISGSRLVSLPFSDHCQPLLQSTEDLAAFTEYLRQGCNRLRWEYVELRLAGQTKFGPQGPNAEVKNGGQRGEFPALRQNDSVPGFTKYDEYNFHKIDLRTDLKTLFNSLHKSCIQRKIHRAEREGLAYQAGRSESNLTEFYRLLLLTRRRHGLPPQPMTWFRNLRDCLGEGLTIRIASQKSQPIAAILTLQHKGTIVYKYGCSDAAFHSLGAMPMLFWKTIQTGKQHGAQELDLGRSDRDNQGLTAFKQHLGASCSALTYFRLGRDSNHASTSVLPRIARSVFARMPGRFAQMAGTVLYRHMG